VNYLQSEISLSQFLPDNAMTRQLCGRISMKSFKTILMALLFSISFSAVAEVSLKCSVSNDQAAGTFFLAFSLLSGGDGSVSGDDPYDDLMNDYVNENFTEDDVDLITDLIVNNQTFTQAIYEEASKIFQSGLRGEDWMMALVAFFKDPNNGLCEQK